MHDDEGGLLRQERLVIRLARGGHDVLKKRSGGESRRCEQHRLAGRGGRRRREIYMSLQGAENEREELGHAFVMVGGAPGAGAFSGNCCFHALAQDGLVFGDEADVGQAFLHDHRHDLGAPGGVGGLFQSLERYAIPALGFGEGEWP